MNGLHFAGRGALGEQGEQRRISSAGVSRLAASFQGLLVGPGQAGYDDARKVWNGMIDKYPALIARCTTTEDVAACMRFVVEHEVAFSVRGGGHNYAGKSVSESGLMIDLSPMKRIRVDPTQLTAHAQPGLRLGEFDHATQALGLATTLGVNTDTGIAGLTLGGGYGWLGGMFGLACDNLRSAEVVTADAAVLTASLAANPDLYWGLRGAGANLGIVTELEYTLHPVGPVLGGMLIYPRSQGRKVLRLLDNYCASCPDTVSVVIILMNLPSGDPVVAAAVCCTGPLDAAAAVLAPLTQSPLLARNLMMEQPYTTMQTLFDDAWPAGRLYYNKSSIARRLTDELIEQLLECSNSLPTNLSAIALQHLHGAAARLRPDATAFPHRFDHFSVYVHPATDNRAEAGKIVAWGRENWEKLQPMMEQAVYVNAVEDALVEGSQRVQDAYGTNYDRLCDLKRKFDPSNLFSGNQNIRS